MQTTVDAEQPSSSRASSSSRLRWLAVGAVVFAVAAAVLLRGLGTSGAEDRGLNGELADLVVAVLEEASPDEHADHGHYFGEEGESGVVCVAEVFGFDPPSATTVDDVDVVYAKHMCAILAPGWGWPEAVRASGPMALTLTDPPLVRTPEQMLPDDENAMFQDRVLALVPERFHAQAADFTFSDPALIDELRSRVEAGR